jgi:peptide/nickel transport system permease protein
MTSDVTSRLENGAPRSRAGPGIAGNILKALAQPSAAIGLAMVIFWILVALLAPLLAPYPPNDLVGRALQAPSAAHLLGTDDLGRDVLSRVMWGARIVLVLAPMAVLIAEAVGALIGLFSGYVGGVVDEVIMRINDALISFPAILLYLLIIAALGPSKTNVVIAIALGSIPGIARIVRGVVLDLRTRSFVLAARLRGERLWYMLLIELLPNARGPIVVDATLRVAYASFAIGTLGFLGLGTPPPDPDWGGMVNQGVRWLSVSAWMTAVPALALASLVIGLNLVADALQSRGTR